MGRSLRNDEPGAVHHVMNRGARRWTVFMDDLDRTMFLDMLARSCDRCDLAVLSFALMPNHYHLLLRSSSGLLSEAMREFGSSYVRAFNRRHGFDGPLCTARFLSVNVANDAQLLEETRYIHRNPLDLALVGRLDEFQWSSYRYYTGRCNTPEWVSTGLVLGQFGGDRKRYRDFVEQQRRGDETPMAAQDIGEQRTDERFVEAFVAPALPLELVDAAVAERLGDYCNRSQRGPKNAARSLGLIIGFEIAGLSCRELGQHYGYASTGAAKSALRRGRMLADEDDQFSSVLASIRRDLT
jgi:putative transposase